MRSLSKVDRVIVLKDGAIVESGAPNKLVLENGVFAQLLQQYFNDNDDNDADSMFTVSMFFYLSSSSTLL